MQNIPLYALILSVILTGCNSTPAETEVIEDTPFVQDYSIKYYSPVQDDLLAVVCDAEGYIQILSRNGLMKPSDGRFLFPGTIVPDRSYIHMKDREIKSVITYESELVYLDGKAVFSNAWSGRLFIEHEMPGAKIMAGGNDYHFLVSDGKYLKYLNDTAVIWEGESIGQTVSGIKYDDTENLFYILGLNTISTYSPGTDSQEKVLEYQDISSFDVAGGEIFAGTSEGYLRTGPLQDGASVKLNTVIPWRSITVVRNIGEDIWFGTTRGAVRLYNDSCFSYYSSERWLPSDSVTDIAPGPEGSVLVLTSEGMATICFEKITLEQKAGYFERQVRDRHIRYGFNATLGLSEKGNLSAGTLLDSDNDGLWTSMYLAAEAFRLAVTGSDEARKNVAVSLDAMERLYTINDIPGFPSRSFERRGYKYDDEPWRRASDREWDWKSTTSSDEAIGHIFALGVVAELAGEHALTRKATELIDTLMSHIVSNNLYLADWDGRPTRWGKWNPAYVNSFPEMVGDRKLNSSNIIGMLQTAWRFTGKEKYRDTAYMLLTKHGYYANLMRPMDQIGPAPAGSDDLAVMLSEEWNHSDDEMYFCGYWGLYRYAFSDTLRDAYRRAIMDHLEAERPERDGLWNIMAAVTGTAGTGIEDAAWFLREYPLDLIDWRVENSGRQDIIKKEPGFRGQTITKILPPDELPVARHNANRFRLDGGSGGMNEYSAGDIWLLPYWMGRFLGVIRDPVNASE